MSKDKNESKYYSKEIYCGDMFQLFVRDKYLITNPMTYTNHNILLLLYAYEWFNYKDSQSKYKFHPYLKLEDHIKVEQFKSNIRNISLGVAITSSILAYVFATRTLKLYQIDLAKRLIKMLNISFVFFSSGMLLYFAYYKPKLTNYIEKNFQQYLNNPDFNKTLIENELKNIGVLKGAKDNLIDGYGEDGLDSFIRDIIIISSPEEAEKLKKAKLQQQKEKEKSIKKKEIKLA